MHAMASNDIESHMLESMMTAEECAAAARVSVRSVFYALKRGELRGRKFGKSLRIPQSEVALWLQGRSE